LLILNRKDIRIVYREIKNNSTAADETKFNKFD